MSDRQLWVRRRATSIAVHPLYVSYSSEAVYSDSVYTGLQVCRLRGRSLIRFLLPDKAEHEAMSIIYDVKEHDTDVALGEHDAKKACALLLIAITTGQPATIGKKTGTLGLTVPSLIKMEDSKPHRDGAPKVTKVWKCGKTKKTYDTKKDCEKNCKSKPSKPPKSPKGNDFIGSDFKSGNYDECQQHVSVRVKYTVDWDYIVKIDVYRLQFRPTLRNAAAKSKEVKQWNETIVEHEDHHVSDTKEACKRVLKDETQYTVSGSGDTEEEALDEAENALLGKIAEERLAAFAKCRKEIEKAAEAFHTLEHSLPRPSFCQ
jgi:hypothetical protein